MFIHSMHGKNANDPGFIEYFSTINMRKVSLILGLEFSYDLTRRLNLTNMLMLFPFSLPKIFLTGRYGNLEGR